MRPQLNLLGNCFDDGEVGVSQQKRSVPGYIVDVFVAVHIPFARTRAMGHVQREWLGVAGVMGNAARKDLGGFNVPLG